MNVIGISWVGVRTDRFQETRRFFEHVLGMTATSENSDFAVFRRPAGDTFEIFGPRAELSEPDQFSRNQVVVGILVDDIDAARAELTRAGIELLGDVTRAAGGYSWQHFRGPDGNTWELVFDPDHPGVRAPT